MLEGCVPWPEGDVRRNKKAGYWEDLTIGDHLNRWVEKYGNRPALAFQGKEVTYRQMDEYVTRLAYHMVRLRMKTYDRIIVQLFNVPEAVYLFYACMKIGVIPVCTLPTHRWAEISFLSELSEARAHAIHAGAVKDFDCETFAKKIRDAIPSMGNILTVGKPQHAGMVSINDLMETDIDLNKTKEELAQCRPDPMEPALFQLSGGTTSVPKIIPRTHNDYYYSAKCNAIALEFNEETRALITLPIMHNAPLINMLLPVHYKGGTVALVESFAPESILKGLEKNKASIFFGMAVHLHRILAIPRKDRQKYDLSSLKQIMGAWNPEDKEIEKFFHEFHCEGVQTYGMTEGLVCWSRWSDPTEIRHGTNGRPTSEVDELKIVDPETEREVQTGEVGEMLCRGPCIIQGYYKSLERNQIAFTPEGYYRTGDLVRRDAQGNLTWCGRTKDCIDRGAEKINAEEVEDHILNFPKVKGVAAVGMPDKEMGERICVFVVPQPGESFTLKELCDFLSNERQIAKFKLPERLEFIDELPVTKIGKYEKKSLREKITEKLRSEGKIG